MIGGLKAATHEEEKTMTTTSRLIRGAALLGALFIGLFMADAVPTSWNSSGAMLSQAKAVVGRPATPGSVAGVARRTTRRTVRRHY
jgi:Na+-translocating ferredoxin:NAD+ oxidoreductase RnfD subunit